MLLVTLLQLALATLCGTAFGTASVGDADRRPPPVATPVPAQIKNDGGGRTAAAPAAKWTQDVFGSSNCVPPDVPATAGWVGSPWASKAPHDRGRGVLFKLILYYCLVDNLSLGQHRQ